MDAAPSAKRRRQSSDPAVRRPVAQRDPSLKTPVKERSEENGAASKLPIAAFREASQPGAK